MHGIQSEQPSGQAECCDHLLSGRDFVAFLSNRQVAEDDLAVTGKRAQYMGCFAVAASYEDPGV